MNEAEDLSIELDEAEDQPEATETHETPEAEPKVEEAPKVTFTDEQQEILNREIGKKTAKMRETERALEDARREKEELAERLAKLETPARPVIPDMPDPFADDFEDQIKARDKAILEVAQYDAMEAAKAQKLVDDQRQAQVAAAEKMNKVVSTYSDRADKLGIDADQLARAGAKVSSLGIDDQVAGFILNDEHGPAITVHLSENPMVLDKINEMDPIRAAIHIETVVKPMATDRKAPDPAPEPTDDVRGMSYREEKGPPGATYE